MQQLPPATWAGSYSQELFCRCSVLNSWPRTQPTSHPIKSEAPRCSLGAVLQHSELWAVTLGQKHLKKQKLHTQKSILYKNRIGLWVGGSVGTALLNRSHQVINGTTPAPILPNLHLHQKFNYGFVTGAQHTTLTWLYKYIFTQHKNSPAMFACWQLPDHA